MKRTRSIILNCPTCFREFTRARSALRPVNFCSYGCRTDRRPFTEAEREAAEAMYRDGSSYKAIVATLGAGRTIGGVAVLLSRAIHAGRVVPRRSFQCWAA